MNYKQSPRAARKFSGESGTPKSQKKVRIQDEIEVQETENYIQDLSDIEANDNESNEENLNPDDDEGEVAQSTSEKKSPKSILKGSQKVEEVAPTDTPKVESGSLKKKFKNPLQRIKKMADQQFKKVKSTRPFIKKIPVSKDVIVLNDEVKILKLKESPKSQHREIPSFVVKHQDSEDSVEILDLNESPMESRRRKDIEAHIVTPDEIIELPEAEAVEESSRQSEPERESTVESHEISISKSSSQSPHKDEPVLPNKREHVYEDIDDYISRITSDNEHVDRAPFLHDAKLERQQQISQTESCLDEFSREMNKSIRRSLSVQDDKVKQDLTRKIPKIEDLEKQISDEDKEEKLPLAVKQSNLLAPISSIDSTSSDEDMRRQLSIVAEESDASDSNKKKSFDDSSVDREVESLKNDESDVSITLIEDELKVFEKVKFEVIKVEEPIVKSDVKPVEIIVQDESSVAQEEAVVVEEKPVAEVAVDTQEPSENLQEVTLKEDIAVKEDVVVKAEAVDSTIPKKISERWSKMRFVLSVLC